MPDSGGSAPGQVEVANKPVPSQAQSPMASNLSSTPKPNNWLLPPEAANDPSTYNLPAAGAKREDHDSVKKSEPTPEQCVNSGANKKSEKDSESGMDDDDLDWD